ncbi:MAG: DUF6262 family protein [Nocardioidaceae bacterium]
MRPDNTGPLIAAARTRRELTRAKAVRALRELEHAGTSVTFESIARTAGVSRSWLYAQPDIRVEIERLRDSTRQAPSSSIPARQRASEASLLRRLTEANQRNRQLAEENARLRRELAHALGDQRTSARVTRSAVLNRPAASPSSITIGPC